MATESPSQQRSDEATLTSATEPAIKIDNDSRNVGPDGQHVNGGAPAPATDEVANKHISDIVDDLVNSTEVSVSGGSDNEAARSDASKSKGDAKGRVSSTVKKTAPFKPVNVNKTFLTSKSSAPSAQTKPAEKAASSTSSTPTPAGTPTTSRPRLVAKTGSGLIAKTSGANGGKPGSVPDANAVWNKNRPAPAPEPKKYTDEELKKYGIHMATRLQSDDNRSQNNWADIEDDDDDWTPEAITWKDGTKIAIAQPEESRTRTPPTEAGAKPTSKENGFPDKAKSPAPGASPSIKPGVLASGKSLVLKGAPEKPTLVAKPPAPPAPAKSPWAPLPKIDKVSPVAADVSSQAGPKSQPKDSTMHKTNTPPPPKEIAADDFSRAPWRDGPPNASRELFNSQSGRYEPVVDRRGPTMRPEAQHGRQPALLQRPPQHHDQQGAFEPPFQGGRNNEPSTSYGRRRGSSNVSGGSGSWQRLRGLEHPLPPPELINARRGSTTGGSDDPASPRNFSPSGVPGGPRHGQAWQPRVSPGPTHATPYQQGPHAPDGRIMPPPAQQPNVVPVTEEDYELQKRLMRERRELARKRREEEEAREEAARRERIRLKLEALGPAPEPKSAKKAAAKDQGKEQPSAPTQIQAREAGEPRKPVSAGHSPAAEKSAPASAVNDSSTLPVPPSDGAQAQTFPPPEGTVARQQPQGPSHAHPWASPTRPTDRLPQATWGPQPPTANVWGAPNNDRSLGNGTFASDIGASQLPQLANKAGPGPIAPPNGGRSAAMSQAAMPASRQPPIGPPRKTSRNEQSSGEREMRENPWAAAVRANDDKFAEMLNAQYEERDRQLQAEGRSLADIQPAIRDTWRPTKLDDNGVRIEGATKQTLQIGQDNPWATSSEPKPTAVQQTPPAPNAAPSEYGRDMTSASLLGAKVTASQQGRGSRFFPSRDARQEANAEAPRHKSPSPPPPDMAGHPAFDGDATHPHVSLPRPHPVVRLPPSVSKDSDAGAPGASNPAFGQQRSQAPSFAWASQPAYRENENAPRKPDNMWQAKIDNLLGGRKVPTPAAKPADTSNRSLHQQYEPAPHQEDSVTSKGMSDQCFEEPEMGSVPAVRIPSVVPEMAWQPSPEPGALPKALYAVVSSAESISFPVDVSGAGTVWHVRIPGRESKSITIPFGRTRSNPRRGGPRGGRHSSGPHHRQGKGREASSSYSTEQGAGGHRSNTRNHRGGYRGRDHWSRNAPAAPVQT
ncbi:hypothetical protein VTK26DRAFT_3762 [Humicola hyalothermophila]